MNFADAYVVLGDILFAEQDYQLALRAYYRAQNLSHPNYTEVNNRASTIRQVWQEQAKPGFVVERDLGHEQVSREFELAAAWRRKYIKIESERLEAGQDASFAEMKTVLAEQGVEKPKIIEAAHYRGNAHHESTKIFRSFLWVMGGVALLLFGMTVVVVLVVILVVRRVVAAKKESVAMLRSLPGK